MLIIWTAAEASIVKKTVGETLKAMRPDVPPHQIVPWVQGEVPPVAPGDVLLICGTKPLETLREHSLVPKNRTVNSLRETVLPVMGGKALVTFDPTIIQGEPHQKQVIDWDVRLAVRLMATGGVLPQLGTYEYVNDFQPMIDEIEALFLKTGRPVDVAMDTETMGFHPYYEDKDIVSIQFSHKVGYGAVLYLGQKFAPPIPLNPDVNLFAQIEWLMTTDKISMKLANGKFDLNWIAVKWGIICTNFKMDTLMVGSLLDENRSNSLNMHAKLFTTIGGYDDEFNDTIDKGHMELVKPDEKFAIYAGGDGDACLQASHVLKDQLMQDGELTSFYVHIMHPSLRAFEGLERRGCLVDREKFAILREEVKTEMDTAYAEAVSLLPMKMQSKYRDRIAEQLADNKSPFLPSILKEFFFSPNGLNLKPKMLTGKTQEPSTSKAHLKMFADNPVAGQMVKLLTTGDQASKTVSTFIDGFVKHIRPDNRWHSTYMLYHGGLYDSEEAGDDAGTVTGRLSAKDPAFQIIPKKTKWGKRIRGCIVAPPGKAILALDYIQGELKVVSCVANEKSMLAAYEAGMDLHAVTGAKLAGVEYDTFKAYALEEDESPLKALYKDARDRAKAGNFGLLYGMGVDGFIAYAWANYGLKLTTEEATKIRNDFFDLYPGLLSYHDKQRAIVNKFELVRSPLGRARHLPSIRSWKQDERAKAERQAINSPIQSTLSDMLCWSLALIEDAYPNEEIASFGMIHDAAYFYVDEDKIELRAQQAAEIMGNLPFHKIGWDPQLKFAAEAEAGLDLAHLHGVHVD